MKEGIADDQHKDAVPTSDQTVLKGLFMDSKVSVLKDDGINTNAVSKDFVKRHRRLLQLKSTDVIISDSSRSSTERATGMIIDAELQIGSHSNKSNWIVSD